MKSTDNVNGSPSTPIDPAVIEALKTFVAAPNMFDAMAAYLDNPATPRIVRRMIGDILAIGEQLGTQWAVA